MRNHKEYFIIIVLSVGAAPAPNPTFKLSPYASSEAAQTCKNDPVNNLVSNRCNGTPPASRLSVSLGRNRTQTSSIFAIVVTVHVLENVVTIIKTSRKQQTLLYFKYLKGFLAVQVESLITEILSPPETVPGLRPIYASCFDLLLFIEPMIEFPDPTFMISIAP